MKPTELRDKFNKPKPIYFAVRKDIEKAIERVFEKYKNRLHPESIESCINRETLLQSMRRINDLFIKINNKRKK